MKKYANKEYLADDIYLHRLSQKFFRAGKVVECENVFDLPLAFALGSFWGSQDLGTLLVSNICWGSNGSRRKYPNNVVVIIHGRSLTERGRAVCSLSRHPWGTRAKTCLRVRDKRTSHGASLPQDVLGTHFSLTRRPRPLAGRVKPGVVYHTIINMRTKCRDPFSAMCLMLAKVGEVLVRADTTSPLSFVPELTLVSTRLPVLSTSSEPSTSSRRRRRRLTHRLRGARCLGLKELTDGLQAVQDVGWHSVSLPTSLHLWQRRLTDSRLNCGEHDIRSSSSPVSSTASRDSPIHIYSKPSGQSSCEWFTSSTSTSAQRRQVGYAPPSVVVVVIIAREDKESIALPSSQGESKFLPSVLRDVTTSLYTRDVPVAVRGPTRLLLLHLAVLASYYLASHDSRKSF
ncbi:hypothetical protein C0Q70_03230 [Pomacea canaliculata]|uniref:Uncharacterized protein n=1 Tax=Pomacea canaliculata TaxID=400727 RepID=A0A2T7PS49_POMCA|nr:hypothetical protein C0Q70_03230 [Pomacea canaliculata]